MMVTWGDLSPDEQAALVDFASGKDVSWVMQSRLIKCGVLKPVDIADNGLTDAGRALLAQATAPQDVKPTTDVSHVARPKLGDTLNRPNKPVSINGFDFVKHNYAEKIKAGECIVRSGDIVVDVIDNDDEMSDFVFKMVYENGSKRACMGGRFIFTVTWLPTAPAAGSGVRPSRVKPGDIPEPFPYDTLEQLSLDLADMTQSYHAAQAELETVRAERDALRGALEAIALNAPQIEPRQYDYMRNYATADSYYTAGKLAVATLKASGNGGGCNHEHSTIIASDDLSGSETFKRRCKNCGHVWDVTKFGS